MIQHRMEADRLVVSFDGRLDTVACTEVEQELFHLIQQSTGPVVFDLKDVEYVSSKFLGLCLKTGQSVGAERFSIVQVSPDIKKVFKIARLDTQLKIQ